MRPLHTSLGHESSWDFTPFAVVAPDGSAEECDGPRRWPTTDGFKVALANELEGLRDRHAEQKRKESAAHKT